MAAGFDTGRRREEKVSDDIKAAERVSPRQKDQMLLLSLRRVQHVSGVKGHPFAHSQDGKPLV